ncbi:hypothetical protein N4R57_13475 [Rhodobacteraceae bacterium D3-12]|nr:hypothetical protein N4R57_13475 [Rhodobacteraceae bacterium D3-12]
MLDNFFIMIAMGIGAAGGAGPSDKAPPVSSGGVVVAEPPKAGDDGAVVTQPPAVTGAVVQPPASGDDVGGDGGGDDGGDDGGGFFAGTDETAKPAPQATTPAPQVATPDPAPSAQVAGGYVAEPQVPTGKFTTAVEIKPIMGATKGNWVAVREYDGNDLIYFTHLLSWRCGLVGVKYSINGAPMKDWPLPPCQIDTNAPNAIQADAKIYEVHQLQSIGAVTVEIIYDDLTRDTASFERKQILMP